MEEEKDEVLENWLNHDPVAKNVRQTLDHILALERQVDFLIAHEMWWPYEASLSQAPPPP